MMKYLLLTSFLLIVFQNFSNGEEPVKKIWPHIYLSRGADYQEMSDLISKKKVGYINEMMDILVKSMERIYEAGGFAMTSEILEAILTFNDLYTSDLENAHKLLPASISIDFSSSLIQLFKKHNIPNDRRKFVFTHGKLLDFVSTYGSKNIPTTYLKSDVDYVLIGEYMVTSRSDLRLAISLIEIKTGNVVGGFNVESTPSSVPAKLAQAVFDFFQKNQSPAFENPQTGLTWITEPTSEAFKKEVTRNQARTYCASQRYRLPYAEEIMQLSGGGNYHPGGFELIREGNSCYFVADNKDMDNGHYAKGAYYYYTGLDEHKLYNGEIQPDWSLGNPQKCFFVCVKGEVTKDIDMLEKLYEIHRSEFIRGKKVDDNIRSLVKYIISKLDNYVIFHRSIVNQGWSKYYPLPQDGINALRKAGYLE